jgi:flavodoxin
MKVLVVYFSRSGNTQKVAEAIFKEIESEKEIKKLDEIDNLEGYDLAFVGFPIEGFGPPKNAKKFLDNNCIGKRMALFITHSAPEGSTYLKDWLSKCKDAAEGTKLVGMFNCQGDLAQNVKEMMMKHEDPQIRAWGEMAVPQGKPDKECLDRARAFAREIMEKEG